MAKQIDKLLKKEVLSAIELCILWVHNDVYNDDEILNTAAREYATKAAAELAELQAQKDTE
jgi:hypothetical protein